MTEAEFTQFLDDISSCFMDRDFALWERRVTLPLSLITQAGPVTLYDRDALQENFNHYLSACRIMELDTIHREPIALEDCRDGSFIGTYRTELLSKGKRQTKPYTSSALIEFADGNWRLRSIMNARGHHDWTGYQPHKPGEPK